MKVIPRLYVSCLYKQTGQASAILPVNERRGEWGECDADGKKNEKKKTTTKNKPSAFYDSALALGLGRVINTIKVV